MLSPPQVHIQNATLAGGVAIGSAANMMVSPGGALAVGVAAGVLSTLGYAYIMPFLEGQDRPAGYMRRSQPAWHARCCARLLWCTAQ